MNEATILTISFQIYENENNNNNNRKKYPMIFIWINMYNIFFSIILAVHDDGFHSIISFSAMIQCVCMREYLNVAIQCTDL